MKCCVVDCKTKNSQLFLFPLINKFPFLTEHFDKWVKFTCNEHLLCLDIQAIRRNYRVCSEHFKKEDLNKHGGKKFNALPTLNRPKIWPLRANDPPKWVLNNLYLTKYDKGYLLRTYPEILEDVKVLESISNKKLKNSNEPIEIRIEILQDDINNENDAQNYLKEFDNEIIISMEDIDEDTIKQLEECVEQIEEGVEQMEENLEKMKDNFEEIKIPVPWGFISGKFWGNKSQQPILALHDRQDNAGTFDTLAPILVKNGFSLLAVDLPGHGFSSHYPPGMCYNILWIELSTVRRIVRYFKWEKILLIGHSLGAVICFMYSACYPHEVDKCIQINIVYPLVSDYENYLVSFGARVDQLFEIEEQIEAKNNPSYEFGNVIDIVENEHKDLCTRESCEILMTRDIKLKHNSNKCIFNRDPRLKASLVNMLNSNDVLLLASKIKCKMLNIKASNDSGDEINSEFYEFFLKISETAESLKMIEVNGSHYLHLDDPTTVSKHIIEFLEEC